MEDKFLIPPDNTPGMEHYNSLSSGHKKAVLEVAKMYMDKLEIVKCPWCGNDTSVPSAGKKYEKDNIGCNRCWLDCLDRISLEAKKHEGWRD